MRKGSNILSIIILGVFLIYCSQKNANTIIDNADYNSQTHSLRVDLANNPDTSILEIIALSDIRKSGYGLLLIVENSYSTSELDTLIRKFQKQDINAVHSFNISISDSLQKKKYIAMEGAKFIWILDKKNMYEETTQLFNAISAIQKNTKNNVLIVQTGN